MVQVEWLGKIRNSEACGVGDGCGDIELTVVDRGRLGLRRESGLEVRFLGISAQGGGKASKVSGLVSDR